jgi:RNA polymerase sigma factor (sigma-70 family)
MAEAPSIDRDNAPAHSKAAAMTMSAAEEWFLREVLPLEAALMQFLQHNWRNKSDIADLRQEVYVLVYDAALKQIPDRAKAFVFKTARNLLINRVRQLQVIPIDAAVDAMAFDTAADAPGPEQTAVARDELRLLQNALNHLPPRCREAVVLGRVQGLSGREVAAHMGISEQAVAAYLINGIRALVNEVYGNPSDRKVRP